MKKQYFLATLLVSSYLGGDASDLIVEKNKPNILLILTDQQHAGMMSCTGNQYVKTPNLDQLARSGVRFDRAYATNPVCVPSRFSMMTGVLPSQANAEDNSLLHRGVGPEFLSDAMGNIFRDAGYETVYGGKIHLPGLANETADDVSLYGFNNISLDHRQEMAESCAAYIKQNHGEPFLMVASFINPHDICYMAVNAWRSQRNEKLYTGKDWITLQKALKIPEGMSEDTFFETVCPPLPPNFEIPNNEYAEAVGLNAPFMKYVREEWGEKEWRLHRWAYKNLTEMVDEEIGIVLDALEESGIKDNTLIVFVSDHGDMDASHRLEHKALFYEESVRVPFIIKWDGVVRSGIVDSCHLVMTGLDILPTMCDFAGIKIPETLNGTSLKSIAMGKDTGSTREFIVSETKNARMVFDGIWKYMVSGNQSQDEMLFNLSTDPGEMKNLVQMHQYTDQLKRCRNLLVSWYKNNNVSLDEKYIKKQ